MITLFFVNISNNLSQNNETLLYSEYKHIITHLYTYNIFNICLIIILYFNFKINLLFIIIYEKCSYIILIQIFTKN